MRRSSLRTSRASAAPPRSVYRKIQIALSEARRSKADSLQALVTQIRQRGHLDFTCFKVIDGSVETVSCSEGAVFRTVKLCVDLGLIDDTDGRLTKHGMAAADPDKFDKVMRRLLTGALKRFGTPLDGIRGVISDLLANYEANVLPTWEAVYDRLGAPGGNAGRDTFRIYLSLLSACQGIDYSRKKIYLP